MNEIQISVCQNITKFVMRQELVSIEFIILACFDSVETKCHIGNRLRSNFGERLRSRLFTTNSSSMTMSLITLPISPSRRTCLFCRSKTSIRCLRHRAQRISDECMRCCLLLTRWKTRSEFGLSTRATTFSNCNIRSLVFQKSWIPQ